jgi:hypothetical protein
MFNAQVSSLKPHASLPFPSHVLFQPKPLEGKMVERKIIFQDSPFRFFCPLIFLSKVQQGTCTEEEIGQEDGRGKWRAGTKRG